MKIVISGKMGEGKTTVACVVHKALIDAGFNVTSFEDFDISTPQRAVPSEEVIAKRIAGINRIPSSHFIEIETKQLPKASCAK